MPRGKLRKVCPQCGGTRTKRHSILVLKKVTLEGVEPRGVQRWYCNDCKKAFTPAHADSGTSKYALEVRERAVMLYFDQGASYRAVARELGRLGIRVDGKRCWRMVQQMSANCKAPWEASVELKPPQWSGWIAVDGDSLPIGRIRESVLLGVDLRVLDIPHAILAEGEDVENGLHYFLVLKQIGYPFRGVVSDGDPGIEAAVKLVCPGIPHQLCVKHFADGIHRYLRYEFDYRFGNQKEIERFEEPVKKCLYAKDIALAQTHLKRIRADLVYHRLGFSGVIGMLEQQWNRLTAHFHYPGLMRTSHTAEGIIRKLDRRINAMDGFASHDTAWNPLKMLVMHARFRVLTDCRGPRRLLNGLSPLQLAGIDAQNMNWIRFSQKSQQSSERNS